MSDGCRILARGLSIMSRQLRFNICHIAEPVLNKDIDDLADRIRTNIPEAPQYSTLYWSRHLSADVDGSDGEIEKTVSTLIHGKKLLFWVECLSLQDALTEGVLALERVEQTFKVRKDSAACDHH